MDYPELKRDFRDAAFSPSRLTVAREMRGFSKKALAELVSISPAAVTQLEGGDHKPADDTLRAICDALAFPRQFFLDDPVNIPPSAALTFRARRSMTATLRAKATATSVVATDIISRGLHRYFRTPDTLLPDLSGHDPESAAEMLRAYWGTGEGPISNMVHLLEAKGVEVYWVNERDSSVDAFCRWLGDQPFIFLNVTKTDGERGRFDAAHELGHLVLHRAVKSFLSSEVENEANKFASAFLLPAYQFQAEVPRVPLYSEFSGMKRRWGVSVAALTYRCKQTGVFSKWQYDVICREISTRGYRNGEPGSRVREQSQLHFAVFEKLNAKGVTPQQFADNLFLPIGVLESLMPVARRFIGRGSGTDNDDDRYDLRTLDRFTSD